MTDAPVAIPVVVPVVCPPAPAAHDPSTWREYGEAFIGWLDLPAIILVVMLFVLWRVVVAAQEREDFDWGGALKDDNGRESALRLGIFVCLIISTWVLLYITMNLIKSDGGLDLLFKFYLAYLGIWSGAKVAEKAIDLLIIRYAGGIPPPRPAPAPVVKEAKAT